jgi:hypothetical protein
MPKEKKRFFSLSNFQKISIFIFRNPLILVFNAFENINKCGLKIRITDSVVKGFLGDRNQEFLAFYFFI